MLKKTLEILNTEDSIFFEKKDGTKVNYFIFKEFEVHLNSIPKNTIQGWHSHKKIEEIILVTEGIIRVETIEANKKESQDCKKGDLIRMNSSVHRILNPKNETASFAVFRFVPQGNDYRELIKNDKKEYSIEEVEEILKNEDV